MIRIVRGVPTEAELAALIAALCSRQPAPPAPRSGPRSGPSPWTRSARPTAGQFDRGVHSWRTPG